MQSCDPRQSWAVFTLWSGDASVWCDWICLTGTGGLPWTAADGKAHLLSRDTAEGSESFPWKEMCFSGRQREKSVWMEWYWNNRIKLGHLTFGKLAIFLILEDANIVYELSWSVSEGYPSRSQAIMLTYLNDQIHSLSSESVSDWSFLERGISSAPFCSSLFHCSCLCNLVLIYYITSSLAPMYDKSLNSRGIFQLSVSFLLGNWLTSWHSLGVHEEKVWPTSPMSWLFKPIFWDLRMVIINLR